VIGRAVACREVVDDNWRVDVVRGRLRSDLTAFELRRILCEACMAPLCMSRCNSYR
jgi:hypothetical protein